MEIDMRLINYDNRKTYWGQELQIDLYDCDPKIIRDAVMIETFVIQLCKLIGMKRFGECQVVHFGEEEKVAGFSMTQLIETSLISAHFANLTNAAYLNVFSCKEFDENVVEDFAVKFFGAKDVHSVVNYRT